MLGTITEDGECFFSRFQRYVTANYAKRMIPPLYGGCEHDLLVVLDGVSSFQASAVTPPSYSPELNPLEECWRQLRQALSNHVFDSLDELTTAIDTVLDNQFFKK